MKALVLAALVLVGCGGNLPALPSSAQAQTAVAAAKAGDCVLRAVSFYGDPRKLSLEQSAQLAADLLECVPVPAPVGDAGAQ